MADLIFPGEAPLEKLGETRLPENIDLVIWQGDSQEYFINLQAEDTTPIDLTGHTAQAVVRSTFGAVENYDFDVTFVDAAAGQMKMYMSSTVSATIPAGSYVWNFQITTPSGDVRTYLAGDVIVYAEVD